MERLTTLDAYHAFIRAHSIAIIHVSSPTCSVCHAVLPRIKEMVSHFDGVALGHVSIDEVPEIAGELLVFTVPVEVLFFEGKEIQREGRFIDVERIANQLNKMDKVHKITYR
ncbi:thioredoxin family protein [Staphylococcus lutrae]|uniref:Thiol reductase thioredoxin n=1 Tax=Staphylococcus lutrae TaxID=155085 RepID=A0AAC9WJ64_9STAP|nr:thioredoxin family protein [Staphylococcus lutrae]ARJ50506.1 thiol reductase thioredoxin [Staphylococcus lutrae]PNZ37407.1 thioredoxin [Staphylococcus lutrae]